MPDRVRLMADSLTLMRITMRTRIDRCAATAVVVVLGVASGWLMGHRRPARHCAAGSTVNADEGHIHY